MDYFLKIEEDNYRDLRWNLPEQKQGIVNVIGGSTQSFRAEVRTAEFLTNNYPIKETRLVFPDSLKASLPELPNTTFLPSTDSGTFSDSQKLRDVFNTADFNLVLGDLTKNSVTTGAVASACQYSERMTLITRDTLDAVSNNAPEKILMNENLILFASMAQMQKLTRSLYYPRMLQLSQSLIQVSEVLHKFTLSYQTRIITFHNEQILLAENGNIRAIPIKESGYSPISLWSGELAAKVVCMNLYNPNRFLDATSCAVFS